MTVFTEQVWICDVQETITAKGGGDLVPLGLGLAGAVFAPELLPAIGIEGVGGAAAAGIGAGLGTAAGDLVTGQKPINALESGLLAGGLTYGGAELAGTLTGNTAAPAAGVPEVGSATAAGPSAVSTTSGLGIGTEAPPVDLTASTGGDLTGTGTDLTGSGVTANADGSFTSIPTTTPTTSEVGSFGAPTATQTAAQLGVDPSAFPDATIPLSSTASGGGTNATPSFLDKLVTGATNQVMKNPLGLAVSGLGLAKDLAAPNKIPYADQLSSEAANLQAQGNLLSSYIQNGTLPPGEQTALNQAAAAAKAKIRSDYASRGQSGSSAETQDLNNVDLQIQTQGFQIAQQLLASGIQETGLSNDIYNQLIQATSSQDKSLGDAITNFAVASAGGPVSKTTG